VLERVWPRQVGQTLIHRFQNLRFEVQRNFNLHHSNDPNRRSFGFSIVSLWRFFKGLNNGIMLATSVLNPFILNLDVPNLNQIVVPKKIHSFFFPNGIRRSSFLITTDHLFRHVIATRGQGGTGNSSHNPR